MARWIHLGSAMFLSASQGCGSTSSAPSDASVDVAPRATDAARRVPVDAYMGPDAGPACLGSCTSDSECTAMCGAVEGALRCCDGATQRCYVSHAGSCPATGGAWVGNDSGLFVRPDTGVDAATDAACPAVARTTTEVAVSAPGLPGATLSLVSPWSGAIGSATLDASGNALIASSVLSIGLYYGNLTLVDELGLPVAFRVSEGAAMADVYPACIAPDPGSVQPLDHVEVVLQRDLATGLCAGSVLSVAVDCVTVTGEYTPTRFDDVACGPFG